MKTSHKIILSIAIGLVIYGLGWGIGYNHRGSDFYQYAYREMNHLLSECYYGKVDCKIEGFDQFVFRPQKDHKAVRISYAGAGANTIKRRCK